MSFTTDPEATLTSIHDLATAISSIHPDLQANVVNDPENKRAASITISDAAKEQSVITEFSVVGSRFFSSLEILDSSGDQQLKLANGYSDKDVQAAASQLAHKAGFNFD